MPPSRKPRSQGSSLVWEELRRRVQIERLRQAVATNNYRVDHDHLADRLIRLDALNETMDFPAAF